VGEETVMKQQGSRFASFIAGCYLIGGTADGDHQSDQYDSNFCKAIYP
jgi:hypothetical protein